VNSARKKESRVLHLVEYGCRPMVWHAVNQKRAVLQNNDARNAGN